MGIDSEQWRDYWEREGPRTRGEMVGDLLADWVRPKPGDIHSDLPAFVDAFHDPIRREVNYYYRGEWFLTMSDKYVRMAQEQGRYAWTIKAAFDEHFWCDNA